MKRYLAIFGILFIGVIAGLIVRGIPIVLQVNAGGGIQADRNGDVNGDARLDMSDAVYLLLHIFRDGPQPVALAQGIPGELEGPLADIADSLAYESLKNRHDRFVDNGDQTVTDRLTKLMWANGGPGPIHPWGIARAEAAESSHAGHTDWRLPTAMELLSIRREVRPLHSYYWRPSNTSYVPHPFAISKSNTMFYPAFSWSQPDLFWSSMESGTNAFVVNFRAGSRESNPLAAEVKQDRFDNKGNDHRSFMVRDMGPDE